MQAPDETSPDGHPVPGPVTDAASPPTGTGGQVTGATGGGGGHAGATGGGTGGGTGGTTPGTGGATGGTTATGGVRGTGGVVGTGGVTGTGGVVATGGVVGTGGVAGTGGVSGTGGAAGAAAHVCPAGGVLDCSSAGAVRMSTGQITDFSDLDWNATAGQFCGAGGLRGRLFSFGGPSSSTGAASVDTVAQNLKLNVTATSWAGGGVIFESCVNATAFTSVQFTASLYSGSLSGCTWQVQLQTQDQRGSTDTDPTGGTCTANCYGYPAASLTAPTATATTYTKAFNLFSTPSGSTIPTNTQIVGLQWQVTSASQDCTAELRIDNIRFQ